MSKRTDNYAKLLKEGEHADLEGLVAKYKTKVNSLGYSGTESDDGDIADEGTESVEDSPSESDDEEDVTYNDDLREPDEVRNLWRFEKDHPHPED